MGKVKMITIQMMVLVLILSCTVMTCSISAVYAFDHTVYYVSPDGDDHNPGTEKQPFRTIKKAKEVVASINDQMNNDIIIYLREGRYVVEDTIVFGAEDSGTNGHRIIYRNYPGESPIIDGGKRITNWKSIGNGVYCANVENLNFRQLYVDGKKAIRARTPNKGEWYHIVSWIGDEKITTKNGEITEKQRNAIRQLKINKAEISMWENLNNVEMVVARKWSQNRFRIDCYTTDGRYAYVTPMSPEKENAWHVFASAQMGTDNSYWFENAYEFMDVEGEWYLNTSKGVCTIFLDQDKTWEKWKL